MQRHALNAYGTRPSPIHKALQQNIAYSVLRLIILNILPISIYVDLLTYLLSQQRARRAESDENVWRSCWRSGCHHWLPQAESVTATVEWTRRER